MFCIFTSLLNFSATYRPSSYAPWFFSETLALYKLFIYLLTYLHL